MTFTTSFYWIDLSIQTSQDRTIFFKLYPNRFAPINFQTLETKSKKTSIQMNKCLYFLCLGTWKIWALDVICVHLKVLSESCAHLSILRLVKLKITWFEGVECKLCQFECIKVIGIQQDLIWGFWMQFVHIGEY